MPTANSATTGTGMGQAALSCRGQSGCIDGRVVELGPFGMLVEVEGTPPLTAGTSVRVQLRLDDGAAFDAFGRICDVLRDETRGLSGVLVAFMGLGKVEREVLERCGGHVELPVETAPGWGHKYRVELGADGVLQITLRGFLAPVESAALAEEVLLLLEELEGETVLVCLDVSNFRPCPDASLDPIRCWLRELGERPNLFGTLVGSGSVGLLQIRRLAREAGIAETLAGFDDVDEALEFLAAAAAAAPN